MTLIDCLTSNEIHREFLFKYIFQGSELPMPGREGNRAVEFAIVKAGADPEPALWASAFSEAPFRSRVDAEASTLSVAQQLHSAMLVGRHVGIYVAEKIALAILKLAAANPLQVMGPWQSCWLRHSTHACNWACHWLGHGYAQQTRNATNSNSWHKIQHAATKSTRRPGLA